MVEEGGVEGRQGGVQGRTPRGHGGRGVGGGCGDTRSGVGSGSGEKAKVIGSTLERTSKLPATSTTATSTSSSPAAALRPAPSHDVYGRQPSAAPRSSSGLAPPPAQFYGHELRMNSGLRAHSPRVTQPGHCALSPTTASVVLAAT